MPKNEKNLSYETSTSRRDVVKAAAWVVPAVVTLTVAPSFAGLASGKEDTKPQRPQQRF